MMMSFLAHLEGGVSAEEEETQTTHTARQRAASARAGVRARLWSVGSAEVGAEGSRESRDEAASELKTARHHTAASLFNLLYYYLHEDEQLVTLETGDTLGAVQSGQLVELAGEYLGNPIENLVNFFGVLYPYVQDSDEASGQVAPRPTAKAARSGNPATRAAARDSGGVGAKSGETATAALGIRVLQRMVSDLEDAPVHDLLFQIGDSLKAVVTVSSAYYSAETNEQLRSGKFRVVGKVTRVLAGDETINLTRRTVIGVAGPELAQSMLTEFSGENLNLGLSDPIVRPPAVQVLPMAIFI